MFQKGEGLGVICVDRERGGVYFAQHPDSALQLNQIQSFRFITEHERSLQIFIFLTASLSYAETTDKVSLDLCISMLIHQVLCALAVIAVSVFFANC